MKKLFSHIFATISILAFLFLMSGFLSPQTTLAAPCINPPTNTIPAGCTTGGSGSGSTGGSSFTIDNPLKTGDSLFGLLKSLMDNVVLPIGGILAVLAFIYSGFLYVTAQGDETQLKIAHRALLYTSIGTAILLGSWVLANVICQTIGQLGGPSCVS